MPRRVNADDLICAARKAAAAALLARHWPGEGSRHQAFLALAGCFRRAGWCEDEATQFHFAIYEVIWPGDVNCAACIAEVQSTFQKPDDVAITGIPTLAGLVGSKVLETALHWLGIAGCRPTPRRTRGGAAEIFRRTANGSAVTGSPRLHGV